MRELSKLKIRHSCARVRHKKLLAYLADKLKKTNHTNNTNMLEERRYKKRELARLYYPGTEEIKSALKNLRTDIKGCPELVEELNRRHWNINKHSYSAEEVRLILHYLCEP